MRRSTRLRHREYSHGICLIFGILILGIAGCTNISLPKISPADGAAGDSSGGASLDGGDAGRDAGHGETSGEGAGSDADAKAATDGLKDGASVGDGPSLSDGSGGGSGGAGGGGAGGGGAGGGVADGAVDAPTVQPDAALDVTRLAAVGAPCSASSECAAGNCIDSVCCSGPCVGCNACSHTLTGKDDGVCAPAISGQDPREYCADETKTNQCGNDGTCDGAGACRKMSTSHVCTDASCAGSVFSPVSTCDGAGACTTVKTQDCAPFLCAKSGCAKTCSLQTDCDQTISYCDTTAKTCASKNAPGTPASQPYECTSGFVADGVCCNQDNCGGCMACTKALNGQTDGQCRAVPKDKIAHSACTASALACGATGMCDGAGSCQYIAAGTSCGSTCTAGSVTPKACDGKGTCAAGAATSCGIYACAGNVCGNEKVLGQACTTNTDCDSGFCADNLAGTAKLCCSLSCGTCQGCSASGTGCTKKNNNAPDSACGAVGGPACEIGTCNNAGACQKASPGATCGTSNRYCSGGTCGDCTPNVDCTPANACKKSLTSCTTGVSQCVASNTNVGDGTSCGAGPACSTDGTSKIAAHLCNGGSCTSPSTPCANGCSTGECIPAICGNGTLESPEQCDNGSGNLDSYYCPASVPCNFCNKSCRTTAGAYCGDGITQNPQEACDSGASNSVYGTCSPTCTRCGSLPPGYVPSFYDNYYVSSGLYLWAMQDATLYQFKVYHDGSPYKVELYQVDYALENSTKIWTTRAPATGNVFVNPSGSGYDTVTINGGAGVALSPTAVAGYLLLKTGHSMETPASVQITYGGGADAGGLVVSSSYVVGESLEWYQGTFPAGGGNWRDFTDLQSCLQGL